MTDKRRKEEALATRESSVLFAAPPLHARSSLAPSPGTRPGGTAQAVLCMVCRTVFEIAVNHVPTADIRYLLGLTLAECLQAEHWVEEARRHLSGEYVLAGRDLGEEHATTIGLYFQSAQTLYKLHSKIFLCNF